MAFYHPPDFYELHNRRRTRWQEIQELDYVGVFLYTSGLVIFLLGLSWGGVIYHWNDAHVIITLIIGFLVLIVFVLYGMCKRTGGDQLSTNSFDRMQHSVEAAINPYAFV